MAGDGSIRGNPRHEPGRPIEPQDPESHAGAVNQSIVRCQNLECNYAVMDCTRIRMTFQKWPWAAYHGKRTVQPLVKLLRHSDLEI